MPIILAVAIFQATPVLSEGDSDLRLNQIQVIGTHNSYHIGLGPSAAELLRAEYPKLFQQLDYSHPSLTRQLNDGVRQLELDIFADSSGGRYAHPIITQLIRKAGLPADSPGADYGTMERPGFKVMHMQGIDQGSNCQPFKECLKEIRSWSKAHPHHIPVFILIEDKYRRTEHVNFKNVTPEAFSEPVFDALDRSILSIFSRNEIITPDDVRGKYETLNQAVHQKGWPRLAQARGKMVFLLDQRSASRVYLKGHPDLRGRVLFTNASPGQTDAAFIECNACSAAKIDALVHYGYLVRTRADDPGKSRAENNVRRHVAIESGAQIISTDYPVGEAAPDGYAVGFAHNAVARCDIVSRSRRLCSKVSVRAGASVSH